MPSLAHKPTKLALSLGEGVTVVSKATVLYLGPIRFKAVPFYSSLSLSLSEEKEGHVLQLNKFSRC